MIGRNLLPLFWNRDRERVESICYSGVRRPDAITREIQSHSDGWREIFGLADDAVARMVLEDRIDVLMDLTLHMAGARQRLFALKPAPVQVAFAGYPGTTGMSQIDYRLTDPYLDPPGESDAFYSEKLIRLPHSFWCYDPKAMDAGEIEVGSLPALANGYVAFGCLNSFHKVNAACLDLWGKVMAAIRGSRLILMTPTESARAWVRERLAAHGVTAERIEFVGRQEHSQYLRTYQRVDLGLDTIPYNGHTTSLDSLWMGVPVITLIGKTVVGRAGFSQLSNLGLAHLAAKSEEEFVRIAVGTATNLPALSALRAGLRERMLKSPLTDAKGFTAAVEESYRQMWRNWCAGER